MAQTSLLKKHPFDVPNWSVPYVTYQLLRSVELGLEPRAFVQIQIAAGLQAKHNLNICSEEPLLGPGKATIFKRKPQRPGARASK